MMTNADKLVLEEKYINKLIEFYGKSIKTMTVDKIGINENNGLFLVEDEKEIYLVRVFCLGDTVELSIDESILKKDINFKKNILKLLKKAIDVHCF